MGIEFFAIGAGIAVLAMVLTRRSLFARRSSANREKLAGLKIESVVPEEIEKVFEKAPRLRGDGSFSYKAVRCILFAENFESVRIARRIYFVQPTDIEVLLVPEPGNSERKLAVAVRLDSKLLGYVPSQESSEMYRYLLAHSAGVKARAKIYLGSRAEYNAVMLDFSKPLRLESGRKKQP